jgi:hypothetical protein
MKPLVRFPEWVETWLEWMTVTAVAWPVAAMVGAATAASLRRSLPGGLDLVAGGLVGGVLVAFLQSFVLHQRMHGLLWWMLATACGWLVGLLLLVALAVTLPWRWALVGTVSGLIAGSVQTIALRVSLREKVGWTGMSALAWGTAFGLGSWACAGTNQPLGDSLTALLSAGVLGWVVLAMLGIILLVGFCPRCLPTHPNNPDEWFPMAR